MDYFDVVAARHSSRAYQDKPVDRELIEQMIDAGRRAPTARNEQPWEFVAVTDAAMRSQIADLTDFGKFIAEAPVCIVVFCHDTKYYLEDGCAAVENILLAGTALGVQSCWVAGDKKAYGSTLVEMLGAPADCRLIALLAIGYAKNPGQQKDRKPLEQVLHWERF